MTSPGADDDDKDDADDQVELKGHDVTLFRGLAARCIDLSMDRPDILCSSKDICREMAKLVVGSLKRLRRLGRYLRHRPRVVWFYDYQKLPEVLKVHVDANWAGCKRTRKNTSGG